MHTYTLDKPDNLVEWWNESVGKFADRNVIGTKNKNGIYEWATYKQMGARIDNLRAGLATLNVNPGDVVGIIANNRLEWPVASFATWGLKARFVPMYEAELTQIWKYIITDSQAKVLFVSKPEIYEKVKDFPKDIPTLKHIFVIDSDGPNSMAALEKKGAAKPIRAQIPKPDDIAELIYTSGTTGNPKGVLLSHGNFTSNAHAGLKMYPELYQNECITLTILPWAHTFGQTAELFGMIHLGGAMGLAESAKTIINDIVAIRPTFLIAVPTVFNRIYDGLWNKMNTEGGLAKTLFVMGVEAAKRKRELEQKGQSDFLTTIKLKIADKMVFSKIRERMGGRLIGSMTGSAATNPEIARFFFDIGVPIYDCYGLTETTPGVTMNGSLAYRLGSVGRPIDKVKVVIDSSVVEEGANDGEIIVYGPNVMKGYHNRPEDTKAVMTPDGGFRTGDRGRLDKDGYLFITGRIKEQYKLENGKFCFPNALQEEICLIPWVQQAVIYGVNRPFNICIIVPDFEVLGKYAKEKGLPADPKDLIERQEVVDMISQAVTKQLEGKFGGYEIPKKFILLSEPFSLENGTLTQTMKLKRKVVLDRLKDRIEALYA
ncbi:MAG: long-chain fatty acid--CoA ligase [Syntrophaceae bacterium]|jgi:long-chain acyl-CoA synthetase|nr:long-chain fatty acid--CoA ligase [Syntrophaceae bacterium]HOC60554.1 long-chain fatty acid--CoA ligase [Smithellaceae bacterium]HQM46128.1 long-chain fatty acid--CoA ligase [Smithellaceae bacterium]